MEVILSSLGGLRFLSPVFVDFDHREAYEAELEKRMGERLNPMVDYLFSPRGRIGRAKFWLGVLIALVISILGEIAAPLLDGESLARLVDETYRTGPAGLIPLIISTVLGTWISVVTGIKRCHDRGRSGWWVLIGLIPVAGWIWYLIDLGMLKGDPGPNKYGPNPHGMKDTVEVFA